MAQTDGQSVTDVVVVIEEETVTPRVSDQAEEVARAAAALSLRGAELATVRRLPTLRPVARDVAALAALSVTLITAFVFANWAAASALSTVLTDWQAALVLTAAWPAIGIVVAAVLLRGGPLARNWRRVAAPTSPENLEEREQAVAGIDTTTVSRRGSPASWPMPPTFITSNNLAAVLVSDNARQIERVQLAITAGLPRASR